MVKVCVLMLLAVHTTRTLQRNMDWRSEEMLFRSGEKVCPLNAKVHYNIGKVAGDAGNTEVAMNRYRNAILLNPHYDQALNNLGNLLKDMGEEQEAEQLLKRAVQVRPSFAAGWMNLGIIQTSLGKYEEAEVSYITALKHRRNYSDCYYNLGNLYLEKQQHQNALNAWINATLLRPSHVNAWNNMIVMLEKNGSLQDAENLARKALRALPEAPSIHFHLGNILGKLEKYSEAEKHFLVAINADKLNGNYWGNLGVLYHRWKHVDDAHRAYQRALELNPTLEQTQQNLAKLIRLKRESEIS